MTKPRVGPTARTPTPGAESPERQLVALTTEECWALLEAGVVGRVVFVDARGPVALPVNYRVFDGDLVFRTASDSSVLASSYAGRVSFQIDDIDEHHRIGWSVLATGRVERATGATGLRALQEIGVEPWAERGRTEYLRLVVSSITGRRVAAVDG